MNAEGLTKSALLLMSIGEEEAAQVFKFLAPREVQKIGAAMAALKNVTREQVEAKLIEYCAAEMARGTYLGAITRHALGLYRGEAGARGWRRVLSDSKRLAARDLSIFDEARQHLREPVEIFE